MTPIYLDYNSTTPIHPIIKAKIPEWLELYANPSSIHALGRKTYSVIEKARADILSILQLYGYKIVFTASGTEANHLAFQFLKEPTQHKRKTVMISSIEHPCILYQEKVLQRHGYNVIKIPVDKNGNVDIGFIQNNLDETVALCSVMAANNETGVIQDVQTISELCKEYDIYFHCDATQVIGKTIFDFSAVDADSYTLSAHKFYGMKGIGALVYRTKPKPIFKGGMQENNLRAGTENVLAILSFAEALNIVYTNLSDIICKQTELQTYLESNLLKISNCIIVGKNVHRLSNTTCVMLQGIQNDETVSFFSNHGIYISKGAACHSGVWEPSPVLLAMGYTKEEAECCVRISIGMFSTKEEIDQLPFNSILSIYFQIK